MAGRPGLRQINDQQAERIRELEAELGRYQREHRPKRQDLKPRTYDDSIIEDLLTWSDEGQFLDEILAQWCIDENTFEEWKKAHVELARTLPIARTRARAAMLRMLRSALTQRSAFPAALADRIMGMLAKEGSREGDDAAGLVRVVVVAGDQSSPVSQAQPVDNAEGRPTV